MIWQVMEMVVEEIFVSNKRIIKRLLITLFKSLNLCKGKPFVVFCVTDGMHLALYISQFFLDKTPSKFR